MSPLKPENNIRRDTLIENSYDICHHFPRAWSNILQSLSGTGCRRPRWRENIPSIASSGVNQISSDQFYLASLGQCSHDRRCSPVSDSSG